MLSINEVTGNKPMTLYSIRALRRNKKIAMNGSTDFRTIQQNMTTYIQKNANDNVDALKWEPLQNGTYRLLLYRGREQTALLFTKSELQSYILEGWQLRL